MPDSNFGYLKSYGLKYCSLIYYERKTLMADRKSTAYKTNEQAD